MDKEPLYKVEGVDHVHCAVCDRPIYRGQTAERNDKGLLVCAGRPFTCVPGHQVGDMWVPL